MRQRRAHLVHLREEWAHPPHERDGLLDLAACRRIAGLGGGLQRVGVGEVLHVGMARQRQQVVQQRRAGARQAVTISGRASVSRAVIISLRS